MTALRLTIKLRIRDGKEAAFRDVIAQLSAIARDKDPGTSIFECYRAEDGVSAFIHEHYASDEAFLAHCANAGHLFGPLFETAEFGETIIAGVPSADIRAMLSGDGEGHGARLFYAPL
ncbi:putative quinol monooxygenase [Sphingomonas sp.]|uniref:putative quinol monooxygenase n=1 Tax=Sphingomonas sp. TaxID=28214 RepID=UPI003D6D72D0